MTVHEFPRDHGSLANLDKDHHPQYHEEGTLYPNLLTVEGGVDAYLAQNTYDVNTRGDDALIPDGMSTMHSTTSGWPVANASPIIRTHKSSQALQGTLQYAIDAAQDPVEVWARRWKIGSGGSWSAWALLTQGPRTTISLENGWTHYGGAYDVATYQKLAGNLVMIEGLVKPGTATQIATLPVGYRPIKDLIFTGATGNTNAVGRVDVKPSGAVISQAGTSMGWISLSNITYVATQ